MEEDTGCGSLASTCVYTHEHMQPPAPAATCKHTRTHAHKREACLHIFDIATHFKKTLERASRWLAARPPCPAQLLTVRSSE